MDFVLTLHSHLPYVLNHGRWPHGSDWLCEAAVDTYLPLIESLAGLDVDGIPSPATVGITPILANQLAHATFRRELTAFLAQRIDACAEAIASLGAEGTPEMVSIPEYWRGRYARLRRLFERLDGDLLGAFRRHADQGRIELISSAATHGFLPLLARDESIRLQLAVGRGEHRRLFGRDPAGCWVPECAYRPRGDWQPHPKAPFQANRPGIEEALRQAEYRYFFVDAHLASAGRALGLYQGGHQNPHRLEQDEGGDQTRVTLRSPYQVYEVSPKPGAPPVVAFVRDPLSSRQVWSRHQGYPGDGGYLEFHKIRYPGGLKLWRVTDPGADLGEKLPYDANTARARAHGHATHYQRLLNTIGAEQSARGGTVIVAPFDAELYGHWWFEGIDFLSDLFRSLQTSHHAAAPQTSSGHLERAPVRHAIELATGSWGAHGDFSNWLNPETEWTWEALWPIEARFWDAARRSIGNPAHHEILAQAARELLLLQSSDWQFIIATGTATDYGTMRFEGHLTDLRRLLDGLEQDPESTRSLARELQLRDDVFPDVLATVATIVRES